MAVGFDDLRLSPAQSGTDYFMRMSDLYSIQRAREQQIAESRSRVADTIALLPLKEQRLQIGNLKAATDLQIAQHNLAALPQLIDQQARLNDEKIRSEQARADQTVFELRVANDQNQKRRAIENGMLFGFPEAPVEPLSPYAVPDDDGPSDGLLAPEDGFQIPSIPAASAEDFRTGPITTFGVDDPQDPGENFLAEKFSPDQRGTAISFSEIKALGLDPRNLTEAQKRSLMTDFEREVQTPDGRTVRVPIVDSGPDEDNPAVDFLPATIEDLGGELVRLSSGSIVGVSGFDSTQITSRIVRKGASAAPAPQATVSNTSGFYNPGSLPAQTVLAPAVNGAGFINPNTAQQVSATGSEPPMVVPQDFNALHTLLFTDVPQEVSDQAVIAGRQRYSQYLELPQLRAEHNRRLAASAIDSIPDPEAREHALEQVESRRTAFTDRKEAFDAVKGYSDFYSQAASRSYDTLDEFAERGITGIEQGKAFSFARQMAAFHSQLVRHESNPAVVDELTSVIGSLGRDLWQQDLNDESTSLIGALSGTAQRAINDNPALVDYMNDLQGFVTARLRLESGAAISAGEWRSQFIAMGLRVGDTPTTIRARQRDRKLVTDANITGSARVPAGLKEQMYAVPGETLSQATTSAGIGSQQSSSSNVPIIQDKAQFDALPSGATYINGNTGQRSIKP